MHVHVLTRSSLIFCIDAAHMSNKAADADTVKLCSMWRREKSELWEFLPAEVSLSAQKACVFI